MGGRANFFKLGSEGMDIECTRIKMTHSDSLCAWLKSSRQVNQVHMPKLDSLYIQGQYFQIRIIKKPT